MASQNLVSAEITAATMAEFLAAIADMRKKLPFLTSLKPDELKSLIKVGNGFAPFLDKAHRSVNDNPDIMPKLFDLAEFNRDYQLTRDLTEICEQLESLCEGVRNTLSAVGSDALVASLEIYAAAKANSDRVSGLKVAAAEMGEFFKKTRAKTSQGSTT
jgi:hypothetical protein